MHLARGRGKRLFRLFGRIFFMKRLGKEGARVIELMDMEGYSEILGSTAIGGLSRRLLGRAGGCLRLGLLISCVGVRKKFFCFFRVVWGT